MPTSVELTVAEATEVVAAIEKRWIAFTFAGDVDGLVSLFTRDVLFFGSTPTLFVGQDGLREYQTSVSRKTSGTIVFGGRQVRALAAGVIAASFYVRFDLNFGGKPYRARYGFSWTLVREDDGEWRIASHHASPRDEK